MPPTKAQIHYTMSRVRSTGSAIEKRLGAALWGAGFRYRKHYPIIGKPDFVLVTKKVAIFCDSEFWHGYRWGKRAQSAFKRNQSYWFAKIARNRARDQKVNRTLRRNGWCVIRFWEREILCNTGDCVAKVVELLRSARGS